ncbi:hypothetical protein TRSC58_03890 [Trypanosoma rangeli SC58]|uniref:Dynein heavy chain C-terminal domain-containing protein n=1 Tax=Trypanosoma rangeli SC58 TaxID=429131 RepID=A0A061J523_TRYRA|nr:hypothetical protein TRSC58_03890 [Trypanosoma rangeli SC58]
MGGFFFPQAFLTGTLQNYARRTRVAIDSVSFAFELLEEKDFAQVEARAEGVIVYGLYMEGARWDAETRTLAESRPKELYVEMPLIHLDPRVDHINDPKDYVCPVYKTLARAGTLSTTGHSTNFILPICIPTNLEPEHWVKRGVACVVSLNF